MMDKKIKEYIINEKKILDKEFEIECELIRLRNEAKLSQYEIAQILNTKQPQIFRIEKGTNSPRLNTLLRILDIYGYTLEIKKQ